MPEIFGLHDNANITFAQNETYTLLGTIVQLQPKSSTAGGQSREEGCSKADRPVTPYPGLPQPGRLFLSGWGTPKS